MLFEDYKTFSDTSSSDWEGWLSFVTDVMQSLSCMYLLYMGDYRYPSHACIPITGYILFSRKVVQLKNKFY